MKRKSIIPLATSVILLSVLPLTSCHDDNDDQHEEDASQEHLIQQTAHDFVLNQLCNVDTTAGRVSYTLRMGEVLPGTPGTTYSVVVENEAAARHLFNTYFVPINSEGLTTRKGGTIMVDFGAFGSVTYTPGGHSSTIATVSVNLPELPDVKTFEFIPQSQWPMNVASPFYPGDVVRDKNGHWWICVRACDGGLQGILMTWDTGTNSEEIKTKNKTYTKVTGCAPRDAWNALASFYYSDVDEFKNEYNILRKRYGQYGCGNLLSSSLKDLYDGRTSNTHQMGDMATYYSDNIGDTYYCKMSVIINQEKMPVFESGHYYFGEKEFPLVPVRRNSHSITFTSWDDMSTYVKKYPDI